MTISSEDIELADKFYDILNTGYYCDSKQVTDLFNKLTGKNVNNTNCSTCIRHRVLEIHNIVERLKEKSNDGSTKKITKGD